MEHVLSVLGVLLTALPLLRAILEAAIPRLEEAAAKSEAKWDDDSVSVLRQVAAFLDVLLIVLPKLQFGKRSK